MRWLILMVSVVAVSCEGVSLDGSLSLQPCHLEGLAEEVRCGTHEVFEDRAANTGRRLSIQLAVLPALRRLVDPDPLFIFAGGPGQGARGYAEAMARFFRTVRRSRDIVLVDLRGTGGSAPLRCAEGGDELADVSLDAIAAQARRCLAAIDADVRHYTHEPSLDDVDEIRGRLGYERLNLWGGSWGTRAALLYALRFPASTRTVVLDGAVPLDLGFPRTASADAHAALERLIADCGADADCARAFPDPRAMLAALDRRFERGPVTVDLRHPRTGAPLTVTLQRGLAADIIRGGLYVPRDAAALLQVIAHAAAGDFSPLAAQFLRTAAWSSDDMAPGATMSILCSEDLPGADTVDFAGLAGRSFFGTTYADVWQARCREWPRGPAIRVAGAAVSQAPGLILSGLHDPVTPPRTGQEMARHFASSWQVVVPGAAHNASFSGCMPDVIADFIERGSGEGLDTSCASRVARPAFVISDAGTRP
jgi:pimeloyl-ACP methyl ester carboxylesterase